ncbi:MAG: aminodeoxychorismate synthase component I [Myxococcota bacterium]
MFHPAERIALAALDRRTKASDWLRVVDGLQADPGFWWLDSALAEGRLGRHSFAGVDPYLWLRARVARREPPRGGLRERGRAECAAAEIEIDVRRAIRPGLAPGFHRVESDPFECVRALLPRTDSLVYSTRTSAGSGNPRWHEVSGLSAGLELPFLGGAVGYFGYELAAATLPRVRFGNRDELGLPDLALAFVDRVLAYDHAAERLWVVGLGFGDARDANGRAARATAVSRSRRAVDVLAARVESILAAGSSADTRGRQAGRAHRSRIANAIESTTDAAGYAKAVDAILQEIGAGNVYQANYSQRLRAEADVDPWTLYRSLRRRNPAPFGAFLRIGDAAILSSSPERFLRLDESRRVESRPIKGTRPRGDDEVSDAALARALAKSEKDRAENLMIVDLVRNDLGRVCAPGSIAVPELMRIEPYAAVFQMVSTVTGTLAPGRDALDLVRANFPPGSMTGAPKLAAMELLEQLESVRRGVYAGALGYLDLRGGLDLSVVIRTFVHRAGRAHLHVGGGIVADSSPEAEYLESLDKARAPLSALEEALSEQT